MEAANHFILIAAILLLLSMLLSAGAVRMGAPLLLVFLGVGMLAGESSLTGINFQDYRLTYMVAVVALAVILFDGGLRTELSGLRVGLKPSLLLATLGVFISTLITGLFAAWLLDLGLIGGLLMGAIIGSTDAAAVFSLLQSGGIRLNGRVSAILELESGSNDPMAVFLTIALLSWLQQQISAAALPGFFLQQMILGAGFGWLGGWALARLLDRVHLDAGTYTLLAMTAAIFIFALTNYVGGSGFLAIYLVGISLNQRRVHGLKGLRLAMDSQAWLAQVVMFLVLGLIASPKALLAIAPAGFLLALWLILVARPSAVWISLLPFRMPKVEKNYISWVGLRGAVPIVLAIFPLMAGIPQAELIFNAAFFVVLVSLLVQGWTTVPLARRLGLELPPVPEPLEQFELFASSGHHPIVASYLVNSACRSRGLSMEQLPPRLQTLILRLGRGQQLLAPSGVTLESGDYVYAMGESELINELAEWFCAPDEKQKASQILGYFSLNGETLLSDIEMAYAIPVPSEWRSLSISELFQQHFGKLLVEGDRIRLPRAELVARRLDQERLLQAGLRFVSESTSSTQP